MNIARLNFSHGDFRAHGEIIRRIREAARATQRPVAIMADLPGPKIRIGTLAEEPVELRVGSRFTLTSRQLVGNRELVSVSLPELPRVVRPDDVLFINDGLIQVRVETVEGDLVHTRVVVGGTLRSKKGLNLPGIDLGISAFTAHDRACMEFALEHGVDAISQSFVNCAADIHAVRKAAAALGHQPFIIAKVERASILDRIDEVLEEADGLMVARGDLGVEISPALVPTVQKEIIKKANNYGKFVITATQMLESMINNPRPTRAEAADVANAIFDGTDAVMLSAESAAGKYPVQSIRMMANIILESERHSADWGHHNILQAGILNNDAVIISHAARDMAQDKKVSAIVVFTRSGMSALWISKTKPNVPIFAFTPEASTYQWLGICWGVTPFRVPHADTLETMVTHVETALTAATPLKGGDQVVIISGFPVGAFTNPNLALLYTLKG